uniref:Uncharacterized protein n=1 Tax=Panagrellus redivivus TaxID=6233 RepID=A0A7E4UQQ3_PANRE
MNKENSISNRTRRSIDTYRREKGRTACLYISSTNWKHHIQPQKPYRSQVAQPPGNCFMVAILAPHSYRSSYLAIVCPKLEGRWLHQRKKDEAAGPPKCHAAHGC